MMSRRFAIFGIFAAVASSAGTLPGCSVPLEGEDSAALASDDDSAAAGPAGLAQRAYVKASNTGAGDFFGYSVALSADGSTLAVGAHDEDSAATGVDANQADEGAIAAGAVYVFKRRGPQWIQQAYLKASNAGELDAFGTSLALSADGSTLAVGAPLESSSARGVGGNQADNAASYSGAVYVFTRRGPRWSQEAYLKASNTGPGDTFGLHVALSADGSTLAVGAPGEDSAATGVGGNQFNNAAAESGAVYVFTRDGTAWSQEAYVKASNTGILDNFGARVALSGDGATLAVGAPFEASAATGVGGDQASNAAVHAGAVYVFARGAVTWSQEAYVKASNTGANDTFGSTLALSGDGAMLAVGAPGEASAAAGVGGVQSDDTAPGAGAVYVFARGGASWTQTAYVKASNTDAGDRFGASVALSDDGLLLAVGASGEGSASTGMGGDQSDDSAAPAGAVYVLARSGGPWTQTAYVKASNTDAGDSFGACVALAGDGSTLAANANGEDSAATGIGGDQADDSAPFAGAVYLFGPVR